MHQFSEMLIQIPSHSLTPNHSLCHQKNT
jgi:hypothetical protein